MVALLAGLALLAQQQVGVVARVEPEETPVGGTVTLTIVVTAEGNAPVEITEPSLAGLELVGRREQSRVQIAAGAPRRVTTRVLTLKCDRPGLLVIEPVQVRIGDAQAASDPLTLRVTGSAAESTTGLSESVRRMLRSAPPPVDDPGEPVIGVFASPDTAIPGEQVDVITVAWFPQDVRQRLTGVPTLDAPEIQGGWVYHRPTPAGVAMRRLVGGETYDLYVLHAVVFPLTLGTIEIGPARLSYALPLTGAVLNRELRQERESEPATVSVESRPAGRAPTGYRGAVGADLALTVVPPGGELRIGDATTVAVQLSGRGNLALWPEPTLEWPAGLLTYPQDVSTSVDVEDGRLGGIKTFEYLVVADSAGTHRIAAPSYEYFDLDRRAFVRLSAEPMTVVTPSDARRAAPLRDVPSLVAGENVPLALRVVSRVPPYAWWLVLLAPPCLVVVAPLLRRWGRRVRASRHAAASGLAEVESEFSAALDALVPGASGLAPDALADALRAAGAEPSLAAHAARVRDRLREARYGPSGSPDNDELSAEVREVRRGLGGEARPAPWARTVGVLALVALGGARPTAAQSAERLYEAGALRSAVDSFAARATRAPGVPAHWINLGSAWARLGDEPRARVAWVHAARLAPRDPVVRRVLGPDGGWDPTSRRVVGRSWMTAAELALLASGLWVAGWLALGVLRRRRVGVTLLVLAGVLGAAMLHERRVETRAVAVVAEPATVVRQAPFGPARAVGQLDAGWAVTVEGREGAWRLIRRGPLRGWVRAREVLEI